MSRRITHRTLLTAVTALALLAGPAAARAGVLASGYLLSSNAARFSCRVVNVGSTGVNFTDFNDCVGTLSPGKSCAVSGPSMHMAGIVAVEGTTKHLRGVCMLLSAGNNLIEAIEMH